MVIFKIALVLALAGVAIGKGHSQKSSVLKSAKHDAHKPGGNSEHAAPSASSGSAAAPAAAAASAALPAEAFWTPEQAITNNGYTSEIHSVTTSDGYILTLFRIPKGKVGAPFKSIGRSVFLNHGFLNSAWDWFAVRPDRALPFLLANAGYDVWLGGVRGTRYSQRHEDPSLTIKNPKYWNFTLNEIGEHDVPAFIDYILKEAYHTQLDYVGYSQGCSTLFQLLSTNTAYNHKVRKMVAMAPPAYVFGSTSALYHNIAQIPDDVIVNFYDTNLAGMFQVVPGQPWFGFPAACNAGVGSEGCDAPTVLASIGGSNPSQVNATTIAIVAGGGHSPAPASARQYVHWRQWVRNGKFAHFDYGSSEKNVKAYGSATPPLFDLKKVTVPVWAKYGLGDIVVTPTAARKNIKELGNCVNIASAAVNDPQKSWTHLDFVYANDVRRYCYDEAVKWLLKA